MSQFAPPTKAQAFVANLAIGVLLYSVVLGFFNDYTDVLVTRSYSVTFLLAIVMQALTMLTFALKNLIVRTSRASEHRLSTAAMIAGVWLVLFLSKFVFLAVISALFSEDVKINGFVGIMLIVATLTVLQRLAEWCYARLGRRAQHEAPTGTIVEPDEAS
ncbi:hypothetical protein [Lysinibacter cavernae]|uniref:Cytochrome bd-type quinol oxidase subunit 2 n=1 Tax=Lysinibacter cavernae TaxID=1640652 RepID=A0A7X5R0H3_9MICO|nr:hypothetical protein [Lysinibacter cavernae]NIH53192.1 cytochrome bd-type quinol oxidase subunit 2 [Lysinibacter cavernae]